MLKKYRTYSQPGIYIVNIPKNTGMRKQRNLTEEYKSQIRKKSRMFCFRQQNIRLFIYINLYAFYRSEVVDNPTPNFISDSTINHYACQLFSPKRYKNTPEW